MTLSSPRDATRHAGVWLLITPPVLLLLINGAVTLVEVIDAQGSLGRDAVIPVAFGGLSILAAVALLARRRLGWLLAVSIIGWHLAGTLALWWLGRPDYLTMALVALSAVLVTSPDMRRAHAAVPGR